MPPEEPYPTKELRYKICEFFLGRRRPEAGLGGSFQINLQDMAELLEFATGEDREDKIEALRLELSALNDERFGESLNRPVISITNLPTPTNFQELFRNNGFLEIRCSSENLEDYMTELKKRTLAAIQAQRYGGAVGLEYLHDGRIKIVLRDREMIINKTKIQSFDFLINMVKLMYATPITLTNRTVISIADYERGKHIAYEALLTPLLTIEGAEGVPQDSGINLKSIKDAVIGLNKRSVVKLGQPIFESNEEGLKWVL